MKKRKLSTGMIRVILTCWIFPYIAISCVLLLFYNRHTQEQIGRSVCTAMENAGLVTADKLYAAIEMSRQASYDGVIKKSYEQYLADGDESAMHRAVSDYLSKTYKYSKTISNTILLYEEPMSMEYYTYSNVAGATYASIDEFKNNAVQAVRRTAEDLGTRTRIIGISGHLYVVRNIVLSDYQPFATLVMEVNKDRLFEGMDRVLWKKDGITVLDGEVIWQDPEDLGKERAAQLQQALQKDLEEAGKPHEGDALTFYESGSLQAVLVMKVNGQQLCGIQALDPAQMPGDRNAVVAVYITVLFTLIPLLLATFYYLHRNINQPVKALIRGSDQIRSGKYGYQIEPFDKNEEMGQLVDTFNHMSAGLEDSFNRVYVEEIAERDATLKALQSQINPHFLNNTLEIINWKARLSGNDDVSEMIGALSVMMNATLNRNNEMFIPLSEELSYVDAYIYIITERFGSRFSFEKEVDASLMEVRVPRLIIQPIVENAVEHGGDQYGNRTGRLIVEGEAKDLLIRVENNGSLTPQDEERIRILLSDEKPGEAQQLDRMSIGIRNVNLRLRLLYGEKSGLTIEECPKGTTVSTIRIRR